MIARLSLILRLLIALALMLIAVLGVICIAPRLLPQYFAAAFCFGIGMAMLTYIYKDFKHLERMEALKADVDFGFYSIEGRKVLWLIDLDTGKRSLTNEIENVVAFISAKLNFDPENNYIIYRDSDYNWDGWHGKFHYFIPLQEQSMKTAIDKLVKLQKFNTT